VLYSLGHPETFLVLLVGVLLAWGVHVGAQRLVQSRLPEAKWLLQHRPGVAGFVDPFAAVAAVLGPGSAGWTPTVEWGSFRGRKRPLVTLLLAGPLANLLVGFLALVGFAQWVGTQPAQAIFGDYNEYYLGGFVDFAVRYQGVGLQEKAEAALLLLGLVQVLVGVVSLLPLPPLEGGRLLFLFTPKTLGWQKAEYQLAERNIGLVIVLICLIRISGGIVPPFAYLADVIAHGVALLAAHV
jgi:Zn-dependent protease